MLFVCFQKKHLMCICFCAEEAVGLLLNFFNIWIFNFFNAYITYRLTVFVTAFKYIDFKCNTSDVMVF